MRRVALVAGSVIALVVFFVCFSLGRIAERHRERTLLAEAGPSPPAADVKRDVTFQPADGIQTENVLIANAATVSFGELWDVMRAAPAEKRVEWARDLEQMPPGTKRNAALKTFYKAWIALDPAPAMQAIEAISDDRPQRRAFSAALSNAADSSLPLFAAAGERLGYVSRGIWPSEVIGRWAAADPAAAARFVQEHPDRTASDFFSVTWHWAEFEPEKAAEWWANLKLAPMRDRRYPRKEDERRSTAVSGLLGTWLKQDSAAAAAFAVAHAGDPDLQKALPQFGEALWLKSRDEAAEFVQALPSEESRRAALEELMRYVGGGVMIGCVLGADEEEPEIQQPPDGEVRPWLESMPLHIWRPYAGEIFRERIGGDATAAMQWLRALPADVRAEAVIGFSGKASLDDAPRIFELLQLVQEPEAREEALQKFVDSIASNQSGRRDSIAAAPLTREQKQALTSRMRKRG